MKYPVLVTVESDQSLSPGHLTRLVGDALSVHRQHMPDSVIQNYTVSEKPAGDARREMFKSGMRLQELFTDRILEVSGEVDRTRARLAAQDILDLFLRSTLADDMQRELYLDMPGPETLRPPPKVKPALTVVQPRKVLPGEWPFGRSA